MRLYAFIFLALLGCFGCSSTPIEERDPADLFNRANDDIENDRYTLAHEKLRIIKNRHPYSNYAVKAQLRIADVYFLEENFQQAAANYEMFVELHPKHEQAAYASYRAGESYFEDTPGQIARDLESAHKSLAAFETYIAKYPNDVNIAKAQEHVSRIKTTLAEKEMYVGDFYLKRDHYRGAELRYKKLLKTYPQSDPAVEAKEKMSRSQSEMKQMEFTEVRSGGEVKPIYAPDSPGGPPPGGKRKQVQIIDEDEDDEEDEKSEEPIPARKQQPEAPKEAIPPPSDLPEGDLPDEDM